MLQESVQTQTDLLFNHAHTLERYRERKTNFNDLADLGLADTGDDYAEKRFEVHMFWRKVDKCTAPRLYWTTHYSVPLSYLKKLFTQKCWDEAEKGASSLTSELERLRYIRRQLLHPTIPFDTTKHSRRLKDMVGEDEWIDQDFQGGTPFADGLPYHKHDGGRKFNAQNP